MKTFEQYTQQVPGGIELMKYLNIKLGRRVFEMYWDDPIHWIDFHCDDGETYDSYKEEQFNIEHLINTSKDELKNNSEFKRNPINPYFLDLKKDYEDVLEILENFDMEEYLMLKDSEDLGLF